MSAQNRLSDVQLAALQPDDQVVIETDGDFRRPRQCFGRIVRITSTHIVVSVRSDRGVPYVHRFGRRDGVCTEGTRRSELVHADGLGVTAPAAQRRHTVRIDALYREWKRTRDADTLRQLHAAIGEHLAVELVDA
jgi:hypothetical protein